MKGNYGKRFLSLLITTIMVLGMLPTGVFATDGECPHSIIVDNVCNDCGFEIVTEDENIPDEIEEEEEFVACELTEGCEMANGHPGECSGMAVYAENVAEVNGVGYATLQDAMTAANAAAGDYTITLLKDSAEVFTFAQKSGVNITIDGDEYTFSGKITLNAGGGNLTFTDATIAPANVQTIYLSASTAPNITFDDCTLQGANKSGTIVYGYASATSNAVTVKNCTADNLQYIISHRQTGSSRVLVESVTATNMIYLVRTLKCPSVTVKNVTCKDAVIGIDIKNDGAGGKLTLENVNINVITYGGSLYFPVLGSGAGASWTVEVKGENIFTANGEPCEDNAWFSGNAGYSIILDEDATINEGFEYAAQVGEKQYVIFANALAAAQDGNTVTLLKNLEETVTLDKAITLDVNGKNITKITLTNVNAQVKGEEGLNITTDVEGKVVTYKDGVYSVGEEVKELLIGTAQQLKDFRDAVDEGNTFEGWTVKLTADIDLYEIDENIEDEDKRISFAPIGYGYNVVFKGTFDGQNHTIKNLYQNGWALGLDYSTEGGGLFASAVDATFKNLTIENAEIIMECIDMGTLVGYAYGECHFENISIKGSTIANYNRYTGGVVGEVNGNHTFINVDVDANTTVSSLWGSPDTSLGGIIGGKWGDATIYMENCDVACRIDAYNDAVANYQWFAYRLAGMLIGNTEESAYDKATADFLTAKECTVTYSTWVNYHYCEDADLGAGSYNDPGEYKYARVEAGCQYGGRDITACVHNADETHNMLQIFDQLYGGDKGVYGTSEHLGVTVIYPAPVAQIGTTNYYELADAIAAAQAGDTIKVIADIELEAAVMITTNLTLDLNGHTVTRAAGKDNNVLQIAAEVTLIDSVGTGKLVGENGFGGVITVAQTEDKEVGGTFIMNGGTIQSDAQGIKCGKNAVAVVVNGGAIVCPTEAPTENDDLAEYAHAINLNRTPVDVTITGGEITAYYLLKETNTSKYVAGGSDIVIEGGIFNCNRFYDVQDGDIKIKGGTFNFNPAAAKVERISNSGAVDAIDAVNYVAVGYKEVAIDDSTWTVVASDVVAMIGSTGYATVTKALNDAAAGQTVIMVADSAEDMIIIPADITLDLNGKTLTVNKMFANFGNIVDADGTTMGGTLILKNDKQTLWSSENEQLPVKVAEGEYKLVGFFKITFAGEETSFPEAIKSNGKYVMGPCINGAAIEKLSKGKEASEVSFEIHVNWAKGGYTGTQIFVFSDTLVQQVLDSYTGSKYAMTFALELKNTDGYDSLEMTGVVNTESGVSFSTEGIAIK